MSIMSVISLIVSILGVVFYGLLFRNAVFVWPFIKLAVVSVVLPPIAKKLRIQNNKKGKAIEIIAIVIGGFNFYCIFFALTSLPIIVAYLGWVICGIIYKMVK